MAFLRRSLRTWLASLGGTRQEADDIVLAVDEAITNAIEHAYLGHGGTVDVVAGFAADRRSVVIQVTDGGRWKRPGRTKDRGHGFMLMSRLCDSVEVTHRRGTVVRLSRTLARSALA